MPCRRARISSRERKSWSDSGRAPKSCPQRQKSPTAGTLAPQRGQVLVGAGIAPGAAATVPVRGGAVANGGSIATLVRDTGVGRTSWRDCINAETSTEATGGTDGIAAGAAGADEVPSGKSESAGAGDEDVPATGFCRRAVVLDPRIACMALASCTAENFLVGVADIASGSVVIPGLVTGFRARALHTMSSFSSRATSRVACSRRWFRSAFSGAPINSAMVAASAWRARFRRSLLRSSGNASAGAAGRAPRRTAARAYPHTHCCRPTGTVA